MAQRRPPSAFVVKLNLRQIDNDNAEPATVTANDLGETVCATRSICVWAKSSHFEHGEERRARRMRQVL